MVASALAGRRDHPLRATIRPGPASTPLLEGYRVPYGGDVAGPEQIDLGLDD